MCVSQCLLVSLLSSTTTGWMRRYVCKSVSFGQSAVQYNNVDWSVRIRQHQVVGQ